MTTGFNGMEWASAFIGGWFEVQRGWSLYTGSFSRCRETKRLSKEFASPMKRLGWNVADNFHTKMLVQRLEMKSPLTRKK